MPTEVELTQELVMPGTDGCAQGMEADDTHEHSYVNCTKKSLKLSALDLTSVNSKANHSVTSESSRC